MGLKIDLHVHTRYSKDASTTLPEVVRYSIQQGLDGIAVTDHDTLRGAQELQRRAYLKKELIVIPGVEITTRHAHVLGLNVTDPIPPNLSLRETVQRVHASGGIAVGAHPYSLYKATPHREMGHCDAIEVINSAAFPFLFTTYLSRKLASNLKLPQTGGSDAHFPSEIGGAYTLIDADREVDDIIRAIREGATFPFGNRIPWRSRLKRSAMHLQRSVC